MSGQWFSHVDVAHTNSVAKVFQFLLFTGNSFRLLVFGTNLIACRCQCSPARRPSLARSAPFGCLPNISFNIAVAIAWLASSRCRYLRRHRYSRRRARLTAPASSAGELAGQRLLVVAAVGLPSQPSPPLRLARPQRHVAGKQILLSSPPPPCLRCISKPLTLFPLIPPPPHPPPSLQVQHSNPGISIGGSICSHNQGR